MSSTGHTTTDLDLLERWRAGDKSAGSALIKRHFADLHRFLSNKAHGHHDDLIQQTFVACVEARDAFRGEASFRAYLFGLARIQLLRHYRKVSRNANINFTDTSVRDLGTSPTGELARHEQQALLQRALLQVPVDQQIALELTYGEGMDVREVAQVLGIPTNTVYSRLRRAREHLRAALDRLAAQPAERDNVLRQFVRADAE